MTNYYQIDRERWARFTLFEQMGNIGSEVGRTIAARDKSDKQATTTALTRALDLFDATVETLLTTHPKRVKEVLRAKDQFLHVIYDEPFNPQESQKVEDYFMQYALAARANR